MTVGATDGPSDFRRALRQGLIMVEVMQEIWGEEGLDALVAAEALYSRRPKRAKQLLAQITREVA